MDVYAPSVFWVVKPRWYGDKIKKCFLKIFFVVMVVGEWRQNVLESSHLNTKKETGA